MNRTLSVLACLALVAGLGSVASCSAGPADSELHIFGHDANVGWSYHDREERTTHVDLDTIRLCVQGSSPIVVDDVSFVESDGLVISDYSLVTWDEAYEADSSSTAFPQTLTELGLDHGVSELSVVCAENLEETDIDDFRGLAIQMEVAGAPVAWGNKVRIQYSVDGKEHVGVFSVFYVICDEETQCDAWVEEESDFS